MSLFKNKNITKLNRTAKCLKLFCCSAVRFDRPHR